MQPEGPTLDNGSVHEPELVRPSGGRQLVVGAGLAAMVLVLVVTSTLDQGGPAVGRSLASMTSAPTSAPTANPSPRQASVRWFHSTVHGYAAQYPIGWTVEPATQPWTPTQNDVIQPAGIDVFRPRTDARGIVAASTPLPDGMSIDDWIEATLPPRQGPELNSCRQPNGPGVFMALRKERWVQHRLGDLDGRERDSCFQIDVVVASGDRVFLFSGASPHPLMTPADDRSTFDAFLVSIAFDVADATAPTPSAVPPPAKFTEPWASPRYGYDARIPKGWTVVAATEAAKLDRTLPFPGRFDPASMDIVSEGTIKRLWVVSMPIAATADLDAWVAVHFPSRQRRDTIRSCRGAAGLSPETWVPITIGGRPGRERDSCGYIDDVIVSGSRAYVITARSSSPARTPSAQRAVLDAFVASMRFRPDDARAEPSVAPYVPRTTFTSTLYGYAIDVPWTMEVTPGTTAWTPGRSWSDRGVADRFDRRGGFSIVSTTLPRGVSLDDWIADNLPAPTQTGRACRFGFAIVAVPTGTWQDADIGGYPGRIRDGCEVDAVVAIGRRVYVLSARTLRPEHRVSNLKELVRYIDFRPGDATAP